MAKSFAPIVLAFDDDLMPARARIHADLKNATQLKAVLSEMTKLLKKSEHGVRFEIGSIDAKSKFTALPFPKSEKPRGAPSHVCDSEFEFFRVVAKKFPKLRSDIVAYIKATVRGGEPLEVDEIVFGMKPATALALADIDYVPELTSFLEKQDLNHEVDQHLFLDMVFAKWGWKPETIALALARLFLPSQHGVTHFAELKGLDVFAKKPANLERLLTPIVKKLKRENDMMIDMVIEAVVTALFRKADRKLLSLNFETAIADGRVPTKEDLFKPIAAAPKQSKSSAAAFSALTLEDVQKAKDSALVEIPDPRLARKLQNATRAKKLTVGVLRKLRFFEAREAGIKDLSGLEYATSLLELDVTDNEVKSLHPIRFAHVLTKLWVGRNKLTSLDGLTTSVLENIQLFGNEVGNIDVLGKQPNLKSLQASNNLISDISMLAKLPKLHHIDFEANRISVLPLLAVIKNKAIYQFSKNQIEDIRSLAGGDFHSLSLRQNKIRDVRALAKIKTKYGLDLSENDISDVTALHAFNCDFAHVGLDGNPLTKAKVQALANHAKYRIMSWGGEMFRPTRA